jgi:hypothetical protein
MLKMKVYEFQIDYPYQPFLNVFVEGEDIFAAYNNATELYKDARSIIPADPTADLRAEEEVKITVESYKGLDFVDIYVNDKGKELEFAQGVKYSELESMIEYYLNKYYLTKNTLITHNVYAEDEYLYTSITEPVKLFLQGSDY